MLKRLELIGFKSFADRTRFDFAPGITAVVGPNGSGKSNIVDAVKWTLGEQSAKSLRGGEMADVIFTGSGTRKSLGLAEVTMTFDNSKRQLQFDGDEVQITRRVHRDGQGEYLINGQMSRLKDIREMFLGSGAGQHAYSIIEQGRVDALLTSSTLDRRHIFEEAAGISRFKAKKTEALRKLEATELNLNRVRDILQELEKSLRTLQTQAAKAQKYQEYQARLKEARVLVGRREFREIAETLTYQEELLAKLRAEVAEATSRTDAGDAEVKTLEWDLGRTDDALRHQERKLGEARQQIAEQEAAAKSQREQAASLDAELLRLGRQRADLGLRLRTLEADTATATAAAAKAEAEAAVEQQRADAAAAALTAVTGTIAELNHRTQAARDEQFSLVGRAAQLHSTAAVTGAQVERLQRELVRKQTESERAAAEAEAIGRVLADLSTNTADLHLQLAGAKAALEAMLATQAELRANAAAVQPELDRLRDRRGDLRGRADVLEEMETNRDGLGAGVQAVLERPVSTAILGLVADLLTVPREVAPLIDIALGEAAQRFVIRDAAVVDEVLAGLGPLPGRVGFVPLGEPPASAGGVVDVPPADAGSTPSLAAAFVQSPHPALAQQLLGDVLIVESLAVARQLQAVHPAARFVTRSGELLEPDGTITVGPPRSDLGIVSRKSELRDLREQLAKLDGDVQRLDAGQTTLRQKADALTVPVGGREAEIAALGDRVGALRDRLIAQQEKQTRLVDQIELVGKEMLILGAEAAKAEAAWQQTTLDAAAADAAAAALKLTLAETDTQLRQAEQTREARQTENTAAQVALTRARQQLSGLQARRKELDAELRQRQIDAVALDAAERGATGRVVDCQLAALRATASAATAYGEKESRDRQRAELAARREDLRIARDRVRDDVHLVRETWKQQQDQAHAHALTVRDLQNRRDGIVGRLKDDYGIELAEETEVPPEVADDTEKLQDEIADLKRKITRLGSVNLEALEQLATEEARETAIRTEFDDLTAAEKSLLDIIEKINVDSRKLFAETLNTVRGHFQELFRKLFAGGTADILLDDPGDVLESGIEITARPPGKELRSISLLSGGEKTMTAVALLLAIFRSRPSPFCLLDEVDAALDEANTARLAGVLREFLDRSQFIVITHKKRTMAAADVLYGVTMQESGVSKQVATRLDDWPEDDVVNPA